MELRILDGGTVSALRSQSLWHGIASAMREDAAAALSFCRPANAYVGIGYHRRLDDIDQAACARAGLPIVRRQIGGGPVFLDQDQLFFQITLPRGRAPAVVSELYAQLLAPAVTAFRKLGLRARLKGLNDIAVGDRKLSGTGAGQIGDAVTVVGNLLFCFPHQRMAEILAFHDESVREECLRLMRRYVTSIEQEAIPAITPDTAKAALIDAYADALGLEPKAGTLGDPEQEEIERWDWRFRDPRWLAGPPSFTRPTSVVKICAGVFMLAAASEAIRVEASVVEGRIERARVVSPALDGAAAQIARALEGQRAGSLRPCLERFGRGGLDVLRLLGDALNGPGAAREIGGTTS